MTGVAAPPSRRPARLGTTGGAISSGLGTSQCGGLQTVPSGCSALRSMTTLPRATSTPSEVMTPSATLIRLPSRVRRTSMATGAIIGSRNRSMVRRAKWKAASPKRRSTVWASSPARTRPCIEFGFQGPRACGVGTSNSPSVSKKACASASAMGAFKRLGMLGGSAGWAAFLALLHSPWPPAHAGRAAPHTIRVTRLSPISTP